MANRDELVRELKSLRKGRGLTISKLKTCPNLTECLRGASPTETHNALLGALTDLGASVEARALRNALAVGLDDPGLLTDRRGSFAVEVDRSMDTVQDWEDRGIDELIARLPVVESIPEEHPDLVELDSQLKLAANAMEALKMYADSSMLASKERTRIMTSPVLGEQQMIEWARDNLAQEIDGFSFKRWNSKTVAELIDLITGSLEASWIINSREAYMRGREFGYRQTSEELNNLYRYLAADD